MKITIVILVMLVSGCITTKDPRPPLMDNSSFTDFVPVDTHQNEEVYI